MKSTLNTLRPVTPVGIWCKNDVVLTSMRRDYVASTLIRRHFGTKCPLGQTFLVRATGTLVEQLFGLLTQAFT